jgi:hypothetical protein
MTERYYVETAVQYGEDDFGFEPDSDYDALAEAHARRDELLAKWHHVNVFAWTPNEQPAPTAIDHVLTPEEIADGIPF